METLKLEKGHPRSYYRKIAQLHMSEIHHGVLPLLGRRFMTTLYRELASAEQTGVWATLRDGEVIGFICGCADLTKIYRSLLFRPSFIFALLTSRLLISPTLLSRIFSVLFYPFRKNESRIQKTNSAEGELLAIAIDPAAQGKGIGKNLVAHLEKALVEWTHTGKYRVTTNLAEVGSNAFYKALGFQPNGTLQHHRLILQVYSKDLRQ